MKYILGGGIAGLIFAFYNPEYTIVTKDNGQIVGSGIGDFVFIQNHKNIISLMNQLGIKYKIEVVDISYLHNGKKTKNIPEKLKLSLISKKIKTNYRPAQWESNINLSEERDNKLSVLSVYTEDFIEILSKKLSNPIVYDCVTNITDSHIQTTTNGKRKYKHLISTIPAYIFWDLYKGDFPRPKDKFEFAPMYFTIARARNDKKSITYNCDPGKIHKIVTNNNLICCEYSTKVAKSITIPDARINRSLENSSPKNIMFFGRYAEWNPDIRIEHLISKATDKYFMHNIWSEQTGYNSKYVDYNKTNDLKYSQKWAKEYALCMQREIFEFLDLIKYRFHDKEKKLDKDKLLEEWIDVFKYWLSMGSVFGFSVDDFKQAFWKKSKKVRRRTK